MEVDQDDHESLMTKLSSLFGNLYQRVSPQLVQDHLHNTALDDLDYGTRLLNRDFIGAEPTSASFSSTSGLHMLHSAVLEVKGIIVKDVSAVGSLHGASVSAPSSSLSA
jgi:hypothetical protein